MNKNKGAGWFLFQLYKWTFIIPWFVLLTILFGTAAILSSYVMAPRKAAFSGVFWARLTAYAAFARMKVVGRSHIDPEQSYVIVVNHQSAFDIIALYGWLGIDFRWVMKQEIRKVPFLGYACYRVGHVYIDRKNKAAAIQSLEAAKERVHSGTSVLFFPEGTRTSNSALKPFKKGAFKMALDLGLPILPITLNGTDQIVPNKSLNVMPGKVDMVIHPAILTEGMTEENIDELMKKSSDAITSALVADNREFRAITC